MNAAVFSMKAAQATDEHAADSKSTGPEQKRTIFQNRPVVLSPKWLFIFTVPFSIYYLPLFSPSSPIRRDTSGRIYSSDERS